MAVKTRGTIALAELAMQADVHQRTIIRRETELELTRVRSSGRKVVYQFSGTVDALLSRIMAAYRRGGGMRLSHVPDPAFVRQKITSAFGPQPEMIMSGCLLTLAKLATAALVLGYDAGVQINAQRHQRLVGSRHHGKIIDILLKVRLIQQIDGYRVGERCKSYRLTDACVSRLENHPLWWPEVQAACVETTSVETTSVETTSVAEIVQEAEIPHDPAVLERLKRDSVMFNLPQDLDIESIASEQAKIALQRAEAKCWSGKISDSKRNAIIYFSRFACIQAYVRYRADPMSLFRIGGESQRVFHPIAMMPQRLRARLRCQGESVTTLDIRCCQPFLLGLMLRDHGGESIPAAEFDDYMRLTVRGSFYEDLGGHLAPSVERDEIKRLCYRDLFFGKQKRHTPDIVKAFAARFPAMGRALTRLRISSGSLACELQRREACLIFGSVMPALQAAFPETPITTVHDAILVPSSIAPEAKALMARKVEEATGRRAGIKEEKP